MQEIQHSLKQSLQSTMAKCSLARQDQWELSLFRTAAYELKGVHISLSPHVVAVMRSFEKYGARKRDGLIDLMAFAIVVVARIH